MKMYGFVLVHFQLLAFKTEYDNASLSLVLSFSMLS